MVKKLIDGFQTFTNSFFDEDTDFYQKLRKHGQKPDVMIIACSDSRVDPANLFGTKPGEVFVVRNVANLVPPYQPDDNHHGVSAALEFGVRDLRVKDIVIFLYHRDGPKSIFLALQDFVKWMFYKGIFFE